MMDLIHKIISNAKNPVYLLRRMARYPVYKSKFRQYWFNNNVRDISDITCKYVWLGKYVSIGKRCRMQGIRRYGDKTFNPEIHLGDFVSIIQDFYLTCASRISIGENTAIAAFVTITDIDHPYQDPDMPIEKQDITVDEVYIGPDCKIYNGAVILKGTHIGRHCVVGANSVVKGTFPDYCVIAGSPAKVVRQYNPLTKKWEKP